MPFDGSKHETIASKMRTIFGPNGEHWVKGAIADGHKVCLIGAYLVAKDGVSVATLNVLCQLAKPMPRLNYDCDPEFRLLVEAINPPAARSGGGVKWVVHAANDSHHTTFRRIQRILDRFEALELARVS